MDQTVFRLPNTKLHIKEDGTWLPEVGPDQEVIELTSDKAESLSLAYAGTMLKTLSDGEVNGFDATLDAIEELNECIELINMPWNAVELIDKLNKWINGPGPDPIHEALKRIDASLGRIEDFQLAAWTTARGENLAFLRAHSSTALQAAKAFIDNGRPRNDMDWAAQKAIALRDSLIAVHTFTANLDGGYWLRPHSMKALSWAGDPTGWMAYIPARAPIVGQGQVWDHRWALPAAAYAITVRMAVLKAFDSGTITDAKRRCEESKDYINFLGNVFNRMYAGVYHSKIKPETYARFSQGELIATAADVNGGYFLDRRILIGKPYGYHLPSSDLYPQGLRSGFDFPSLIFNVELFNLAFWGHVCERIGLADLLALIGSLQDECAEPINPSLKKLLQHDRFRREPRVDPDALDAAITARTLGRLGQSREFGNDPSTVLDLYSALRAGGDESRNLATTFRSQLAQIGNRNR